MELERLYNALKQSVEESDARMTSHETQLSELKNSFESKVDQANSKLNLQLKQKVEFGDIEALAHKMHTKVDFEKVQELMADMKSEVVTQITNVKKDVKKKAVKKKGDIETSVREQEFANEKLFEEIRSFKDKLTKLANQFDKELVTRDTALKQYQAGLWDDIQSMLQSI